MKYVVYKGEKKTDLLDDKYNRYNTYSSKNLEDYKTEDGYDFIFSFSTKEAQALVGCPLKRGRGYLFPAPSLA